MNFIRRVLSYLEGERGQFGIPPTRLALSPGEVLLDEARRRQEIMQREQMERQFALAQRRIAAQQRATEMQRAARAQQYGLQRDIAGARLRQQRELFGEEMEARRSGEFFAERAERAPARTFTGAKLPSGYQVGYGREGERILEKVKPPKAVTPSWGEKQFVKSFQDTFAIGEGLSKKEAAKARSRLNQYNRMAKQYGFDELFIDESGLGRRVAIKEAMAPAREGLAFAARGEVEKIEERVKPEELKIWETRVKADKYGYRKGEMKMARDGTMMEYVGNDKWLPSTR